MGLGADAPNAPSYDPMLQASLQAFTSDQDAAAMFFGLAPGQLGYGNELTAASAARGQDFMRMAQEAQNWGRQQFNEIWPFAKDYLSSQQSLSRLAGENAEESMIAAREGRQRANEYYNFYMENFRPIEEQYAQRTLEYADPLNAQRAAEKARATSRMTTDAALERQKAEARSYGLDPSQGAYQGASSTAALQGAAAEAGAGTNAYEQQRLAAVSALGQGAQFGTGLSSQALQQMAAASQTALQGLQGGAAGGQGLAAAGQIAQIGGALGGSPTSYGYMANPFTALANQQLGSAGTLYGAGNTALGNMTGVINAASSAQNNAFSNQMTEFNAEQKSEMDAWNGLMKGIGGVGSFLAQPMPTGGFGSTMGGSIWNGIWSDRRLKEDIRPAGKFGALPMYTFHYKGDPTPHVGYMADEVERVNPDAVVTTPSGYKAVNYALATISALGG